MQKVLISLPDDLVDRMRAVISDGVLNKIIAQVLEKEIKRRENEKDKELNTRMQAGP